MSIIVLTQNLSQRNNEVKPTPAAVGNLNKIYRPSPNQSSGHQALSHLIPNLQLRSIMASIYFALLSIGGCCLGEGTRVISGDSGVWGMLLVKLNSGNVT